MLKGLIYDPLSSLGCYKWYFRLEVENSSDGDQNMYSMYALPVIQIINNRVSFEEIHKWLEVNRA